MRRADDLNRHPCSPSLGARLADLRQEHWRHPNVRRGGPFQDRASWCGDFSASRIQDGNPFRARHEVGSGVLRFRPTLCWREMDSDFRFLVPVTRPSTVMGDGTAVSEKGSGFGAEPKVRIHLPPGESPLRTWPSRSRERSRHAISVLARKFRRCPEGWARGIPVSCWRLISGPSRGSEHIPTGRPFPMTGATRLDPLTAIRHN